MSYSSIMLQILYIYIACNCILIRLKLVKALKINLLRVKVVQQTWQLSQIFFLGGSLCSGTTEENPSTKTLSPI